MSGLRQGFSWWCFENRGIEADALLAGAKKIGYEFVDLVDERLWPQVRANGLRPGAVSGHHSIQDGLNRIENRERIELELRANIRKAEQWEVPVLICFSGNRSGRDGELETSAETLARMAPEAESAGVTLAVELLNSKVDHKDYQCDTTGWGVRLCQMVNSPAVKLLYDIYHMQIMEGDLVRTIEKNHAWFGHYHTAGNPGRGQPDESQEIYYPAVYRAIAATNSDRIVAHEFLPAGDPMIALEKAFRDCAAAI